jgi:hypothetical protein
VLLLISPSLDGRRFSGQQSNIFHPAGRAVLLAFVARIPATTNRASGSDPVRPPTGGGNAVIFLLMAGLFCIIAPRWILCATGMGELEDEGCFHWVVRLFGAVLVGIVAYFWYFHHPTT